VFQPASPEINKAACVMKVDSRIDEDFIDRLSLIVTLFLLAYLENSHQLSFITVVEEFDTCSRKRSRCSKGSFNSVYALAISIVQRNASKRSQRPGRERCHLARGDITFG